MADAALSALFDGAQVKPVKLMICVECGETCERTNNAQKYCPQCKKAVARERSRLANNKGVIGSIRKCEKCSTSFIASGSRQKFCVHCGDEVRLQNKRDSERRSRSESSEPVGINKICAMCNESFVKTGTFHRFCSVNCKTMAKRKGRAMIACVRCGCDFVRSAGGKHCAPCGIINLAEKRKIYLAENAPRYREHRLKWVENNPEKLKQSRKDRKENPEYKLKESQRIKALRKSDPSFVIASRIRASLGSAIREKKAGRHWETLVGYTLAELMSHLEKQFLPGMSWENRCDWHIDHILPVSSFVFEANDDREVRACWALYNLRPLWIEDNLSKNAKRTHLI